MTGAPPPDPFADRRPSAGTRLADRGFRLAGRLAGWLVLALVLGIAAQIGAAAWPAVQAHGAGFVAADRWNAKVKVTGPDGAEVTGADGRPKEVEVYGVWPQVWGTLYSSLLGVGLATLFGLAVAVVLTEGLLPARAAAVIAALVELLAAIPSVVYGLWGLAVVVPLLRPATGWVHEHLGDWAVFGTRPLGPGLLPAALVLAVMILPTVAAVGRSALAAVGADVRAGAMALGATRWEVIRRVTLPAAGRGIGGAVVLGLGRAMGETMALAMLVGNAPTRTWSLFAPADTLAAMLANRFPEAGPAEMARLMYAALVLLGLTLAVNVAGVLIAGRGRVR